MQWDDRASMTKIIAIEGIRGTGKSTLLNQLYDKYQGQFQRRHFPTYTTITRLKSIGFDMTDINQVIAYNMNFVADFMSFKRELENPRYKNMTFILDRYILSNLAHFAYDVQQIDKAGAFWYGIQKTLHTLYNDFAVAKPDLIIYLRGQGKQTEEKFDDALYKGKEGELEWFYNTELGALRNEMKIPFHMAESFQPNDGTLSQVETILKSYSVLV